MQMITENEEEEEEKQSSPEKNERTSGASDSNDDVEEDKNGADAGSESEEEEVIGISMFLDKLNSYYNMHHYELLLFLNPEGGVLLYFPGVFIP